MIRMVEVIESVEAPKKKRKSSRGSTRIASVYKTPDGIVMRAKAVNKFYRDILSYWHGTTLEGRELTTVYDPEDPWADVYLEPSESSPICKKCGLCLGKPKQPFVEYIGPTEPLVTLIYEGITLAEDDGRPTYAGSAGNLRRLIDRLSEKTGITADEIRWVPMTRCADHGVKMANLKTKGNWCRYHVIEDLLRHPPQMIIPVGTSVLGLLSHKGSAPDWQGRLLTYRGWPDDWLTKPEYMLPRPHPAYEDKTIVGHPVFGPAPVDFRIPMLPIQTPRAIYALQNEMVRNRWVKCIETALVMARSGIKAKSYTRKWYRFVNDPDLVEAGLREILQHPELLICYDTETTGLKPLLPQAAIVSMMFRWVDPATQEPRSLGFPWNFRSAYYQNRVVDHIDRLKPLVIQALNNCVIIGHNTTFDALYTFFQIKNDNLAKLEPGTSAYNRQWDANLCALVDSFQWDTWHMAYTLKQMHGSLGLEAVTYDYAPDLAGYEEDMTLLIRLHEDQLNPGVKNASKENPPHYLNIAQERYPTHVIPYVMGDVESCYTVFQNLSKRLVKTSKPENKLMYSMPLANPKLVGRFRWFNPPARDWVYTKIVSPAARTLMKLMGRGMFVDTKALTEMEVEYPADVIGKRDELKKAHPEILNWCAAEIAQDPDWELDLENKDHLRHILFDLMKLDIQRLTKSGRKIFGETPADWEALIAGGQMTLNDKRKYAALDKFTLNKLAVDHPEVRPLQQYRQVHKLYSTYVRPLRNIMTKGVDKKARSQDQHLCSDSCIHASFLMTGTRGGRLSCKEPNLQQLPNKGDVKRMFTSRFGKRGCIYQADLSQIELRLLAACCGDPTMVKAYFDKTDLHTLTTSRIFRLPYENFTKDYFKWLQDHGRAAEAKELDLQRRIGKTVNFLTGYGGGAFGLQNVLANNGIYRSIEECENIIQAFFDSYPSLKQFLQYYKRFIEDNGVAVSLFGRVRIFEEIWGDDREAKAKALRAGCNHIIQSTAADMMLIALTVIEQMMREANLESILVSTVHDSLLSDTVIEELPIVHEIVDAVLNNFDSVLPLYFGEQYDTSWMSVPFAGDSSVGPSYYDQHNLDRNPDWDEIRHVLNEAA